MFGYYLTPTKILELIKQVDGTGSQLDADFLRGNQPSNFADSAHGHSNSTTSLAGFQSATDKSKLDGIAAGAQVNTVASVAGKTGIVTLLPSDVGLSNVPNLDFTDASNLLTGTVSSARVVNISGNAPTATKLATARAINGVPFDGTQAISVPTPNNLTFGTGLVAGNFNGSTPTTLNIDTGVVVQQSDSRLTDSREWVASTVTQLEAETGTDTTRRAWTAQRVFNAISSWWNSSAGKTKLDTIATGAQVNTVTSVAGKTGAVTLVKGDVGLGNVVNVDTTDASNISSGTLNQSRLSSNVALRDAAQSFTSLNTFADTTNATSTTSAASIKTSGGIACAKDIYATKVSFTQSDIVSFTPTLSGTGYTYTSSGEYSRVGNIVQFFIIVTITGFTSDTASVVVEGLPNARTTTFFGGNRLINLTGLPSTSVWCPYIAPGGSIFMGYTSGTTSAYTPLRRNNLTNSTQIYLCGSYLAS